MTAGVRIYGGHAAIDRCTLLISHSSRPKLYPVRTYIAVAYFNSRDLILNISTHCECTECPRTSCPAGQYCVYPLLPFLYRALFLGTMDVSLKSAASTPVTAYVSERSRSPSSCDCRTTHQQYLVPLRDFIDPFIAVIVTCLQTMG